MISQVLLGLPLWLNYKESTCSAGDLGSIPGLERSPGEGTGYPLWPREFHGVYSPWGHKGSDMTEQLSLHFSLPSLAHQFQPKKNPLTFKSKGKFASNKLKLLLGHFLPSIRVSFIFFSIISVLSYRLVLVFSFCQWSCY